MFENTVLTILILLSSSFLAIIVCNRLRIPLIVGYIAVGVTLGPSVLDCLKDTEIIHDVAEFGLIFLLFSVGLEFSITRLSQYKLSLLGLALGQLILTLLIVGFIGYHLNLNLTQAIIIGSVVAMSSTGIVIKQLKDQSELSFAHAPYIISILLMQDLAVIPAIMFVTSAAEPYIQYSNIWNIIWLFSKSIGVIIAILFLGHFVLRRLFHWASKQHTPEIFTLLTLLIAFGYPWITYSMGMSWLLGAFIAGLTLAETNVQRLLEQEIRPFRDIFMGLFFVAIGSQLDLQNLVAFWPWVLLLLSGIILGKFLIILFLGLICTKDKKIALRTSLCLAQGGEFGFAILVLALNHNIFPYNYGQVILAALLISMFISTFIIRYNAVIANKVFSKL